MTGTKVIFRALLGLTLRIGLRSFRTFRVRIEFPGQFAFTVVPMSSLEVCPWEELSLALLGLFFERTLLK